MPLPAASLRTAVAGITGYAGTELARLLLLHPRLRATPPMFLTRTTPELDGTTMSLTGLHPQLSGLPNADDSKIALFASTPDFDQLQREGVEILFTATPHEQAREWAPQALACGIRVIDLSAAWRLQQDDNRAVYKLQDADPSLAKELQHEAVYGSPELHGAAIARARLVANPGCYATSIILALAPLLRANLVDLKIGIVADAKSGVSGAGKTPSANTHFMHAADNLSAYAVFGHRHTGELLEQLHLTTDQIQFTPHLLPIPRGILSTIYVPPGRAFLADRHPELLLRFLRRRTHGARTPVTLAAANPARRPHRLLRHRLPARPGREEAGHRQLPRQPAQRRVLASHPKHESHVRLA